MTSIIVSRTLFSVDFTTAYLNSLKGSKGRYFHSNSWYQFFSSIINKCNILKFKMPVLQVAPKSQSTL